MHIQVLPSEFQLQVPTQAAPLLNFQQKVLIQVQHLLNVQQKVPIQVAPLLNSPTESAYPSSSPSESPTESMYPSSAPSSSPTPEFTITITSTTVTPIPDGGALETPVQPALDTNPCDRELCDQGCQYYIRY